MLYINDSIFLHEILGNLGRKLYKCIYLFMGVSSICLWVFQQKILN